MNRRDAITRGSLALVGLGLGACRTSSSLDTRARNARPAINLAPVHASWDRVLRTTVGLRPHRPSGFVLRAEKLGDKTLIHDYGHAGAGMSLAWGCGVVVSEFALQTADRHAAVIGCGSPGLTAARQLQRRGFDVTIYAASVPPDTTSNMSLAGFTPTTALIDKDRRTPAWDAQFLRVAEISYRELQLMVGRNYGVKWMDAYNATDSPAAAGEGGGRGGGGRGRGNYATDADLLPDALRPNHTRELLGPGEHPFATKYATRTLALAIEPSIYLDALVRDFIVFGGRIVIRKFDAPRDLMTLTEPIVVNCTGLGSYFLFDDKELMPVKGQLTAMVPEPDVDYRAGGPTSSGVAATMNSRSDGIIVGNLQDPGNWSLEPDEEVRQRNVNAAIEFFASMRTPRPGVQLTRSEPPGVPPPVEAFFDAES
ncbi:MAG TPA: FAD-dependent oxidoreductase [Vicinamibacterales bacterium]|nr:FAD-dependent oxidoreductase [Vicinamibacterales bacterium]